MFWRRMLPPGQHRRPFVFEHRYYALDFRYRKRGSPKVFKVNINVNNMQMVLTPDCTQPWKGNSYTFSGFGEVHKHMLLTRIVRVYYHTVHKVSSRIYERIVLEPEFQIIWSHPIKSKTSTTRVLFGQRTVQRLSIEFSTLPTCRSFWENGVITKQYMNNFPSVICNDLCEP